MGESRLWPFVFQAQSGEVQKRDSGRWGCWWRVQGLQAKDWSLSQNPLGWILVAKLLNVRAYECVPRGGSLNRLWGPLFVGMVERGPRAPTMWDGRPGRSRKEGC